MHKSRTQTDAIKGHIIWLNLLVADRRIRRKVGSRMSRKGSILASSGGSCSRSSLGSLSDPSSSAIDLPVSPNRPFSLWTNRVAKDTVPLKTGNESQRCALSQILSSLNSEDYKTGAVVLLLGRNIYSS